MGKFIKIQETRYSKNVIKRYKTNGEKNIILYFNMSRYKIECETIKFSSKTERDVVIHELDSHFISD